MIPCAGSHFTGTNTPSGARWPVGAPCRLARTDRSRRQLRHRAVLLAPALGEHDLIAVGIPDDGQADLFRFGACNDLDPEFLQAGDAFRNIAFDQRHGRSAGAILVLEDLHPAALIKLPLRYLVHRPRVGLPTEQLPVPDDRSAETLHGDSGKRVFDRHGDLQWRENAFSGIWFDQPTRRPRASPASRNNPNLTRSPRRRAATATPARRGRAPWRS